MSCAVNAAMPPGYQVWRGAVPKELTDWAVDLRNHVASFPFGTTWTREYNGKTVLARVDHHDWTYRNGQLITGLCIKGITLYSAKLGGLGLVDTSTADDSDPLATPDESMSQALFDADSSAGMPPGPNWGRVAATGGAALLVVGLFWAAIRHAGRG
jgi:hypothetical protein